MAGILEGLAKGLANIVATDDPDVKIFNIQNEITELKNQENEYYAQIGRKALEIDGSDKYLEIVNLLKSKQIQIQEAEERLKVAQEEKIQKETQLASENLKYCSECGAENLENVNFCQSCGVKLNVEQEKIFCTNCGAENSMDTKFCGSCGNKLVK